MASCWLRALFLLLTVLAAVQGAAKGNSAYVTQGAGNAENLVYSIKEVSHAVQESLSYHRQSKEALADLQGLPDMVEVLVRGMDDIKTQLGNKDDKVASLIQQNEDMKLKLSNSDKKVEELEARLQESQDLVKELKEKIKELNGEVRDVNEGTDEAYSQSEQEKMNKLVEEFTEDGDWSALRRGLEAVLDHDSAEYRQLLEAARGGDHPLYELGMSGGEDLVALLLRRGLPPGATDSDGDGLLHGAGGGGYPRLVRLLLRAGAPVNARGWHRRTPLMAAAAGGSAGAVRELVQAGADVAARDEDGRTAADWAEAQGHADIARWLSDL